MSTAKDAQTVDSVINAAILPQVLHEGKYRLYKIPQNGNLHLVYQPTNSAEMHLEIPGAILALAEQAANGEMNPAQMMKAMMGMMGGMGG